MDSLHRLQDQTARCLIRYENQLADRTVLAAISGGVDSTVLARVLVRLQQEGRLPGPLRFVHVDHGVRPDSRQNAQHVVDLAERLGVPIDVRRLVEFAGRQPSEDELRKARYRELALVAQQCNAGALVTGHHADDNLETVLFRMLRGTGPRGLAGIPEARWLHEDGIRVLVVRPFLTTRRTTLEILLHRLGEVAFHDSTNDDTRYARNLIRHETIPRLREDLGFGLDVALLTVTRTARAAADILEAQGRRVLAERSHRRAPWRMDLDLRDLDQDSRPFVAEALRMAHVQVHPYGEAPLQAWVERALDLLRKQDGKRLAGRGGLLLERTRNGLLLADPARAAPPPGPDDPGQMFLWDTGRARFGATEWWLDGFEHPLPPLVPSPTEAGPWRALLDPREAPTPWRMRSRRRGDRFHPLGCDYEVELRRYLQSRHVPRFDRDRLPLLVDADDVILWIPGVEVGDRARLRLNTRRTIEVQAGCG